MATNIGVVLTDKDRKIQWVNHDFETMTGYSLSELLGKKPSVLQGKDTDVTVVKKLRTLLDSQEVIKDEILNYKKDGSPYHCKFVIHPIFDKDNELINYIAFEVESAQGDANVSLLQLQEKYVTSSLNDTNKSNLFARLTALMHQEELYINPNLSLKDLAVRLHTNTRYLSQIINHITAQNLQSFINSFRVEEAKRKICSKDFAHLTLYGIGQQCGFKNKSTFYKVFKDFTGQTPNDYIRKLKS